ncbi:MAG: hypothetical protein MPEBLZ_03799 [Candidatus Methanoperedens nitroreducens]|uniref:Uncharacterized protein n=1 Tax=Candidatus Methanoperedens nitratireducens TaxID=1392998 RepID=A0A0P8A539_9EURY|nr:MAG: hypothetical protein MPEBLZ_03799 [Candidatus Methanoperedens sp. BLZ1]
MHTEIDKLCSIIILLSLGIIAVYASIQTAFITGLVAALWPHQLLSWQAWCMLVKSFNQDQILKNYDYIINWPSFFFLIHIFDFVTTVHWF